MPIAVHFGAGNIGRGFVGLLLHEAGYDLVFSDVASDLVDAINAAPEYTVHEAGPGGRDHVVTGFRAVDSRRDPEAAADAVASAAVVTTAVGPTVLRFVAPVIVAGLERRDPDAPPSRSWRARTRSARPTCCGTRSPPPRATAPRSCSRGPCSPTPRSIASSPRRRPPRASTSPWSRIASG